MREKNQTSIGASADFKVFTASYCKLGPLFRGRGANTFHLHDIKDLKLVLNGQVLKMSVLGGTWKRNCVHCFRHSDVFKITYTSLPGSFHWPIKIFSTS